MMKWSYMILAVAFLALASCGKPKTTSEKIKDKIDDALDRRPNEKYLDAAEDIKDAASDAIDDVKDAIEDVTEK